MTVERFRRLATSWRAFLLAVAALAFLARIVAVLRAGGLGGDFGYDDGVYYASAAAFVHGLVPYRDFVVVQPPGILVLLAPFAAIGQVTGDATGIALARVAFMLLGALSAVFVTVLAARIVRPAGVVAGLLYAIWPVAVTFERTTILIPPQSTLMLGALVVLGAGTATWAPQLPARRAGLAGAALGFAGAIQLWAAVPTAAIGLWLVAGAVRHPERRRALGGFVAGGVLALTAVAGPFLVAAGWPMVRQVVLDQLARPSMDLGVLSRLRPMAIGSASGLARVVMPNPVVVVVAAAALALAGVAAVTSPRARVFVGIGLAQVAFLLTANVFFPHYGSWAGPMESITFGVAAAAVLAGLRNQPTALGVARVGLVTGALAIGLLDLRRSVVPIPVAAIRQDVAEARCVASDSPILLIATGALWRDLAASCPPLFDPTGISYDVARGSLPAGSPAASRRAAPTYQAAMVAYFGNAQAALFQRRLPDGLTAATWAAITCRLPIVHRHAAIIALLTGPAGIPPTCP